MGEVEVSGGSEGGSSVTTMSTKEKWYKAEIEEWFKKIGKTGVVITRLNVRKWYKKMWEWKWEERRKQRLEWKINSWSPKELRWHKEILEWWAESHTETLIVTRENI